MGVEVRVKARDVDDVGRLAPGLREDRLDAIEHGAIGGAQRLRVVAVGLGEPFRPRAISIEPWLDRLNAEWSAGCRNGAALWRRLRDAGFPGSLRVVTEWATRRRRDDATAAPRCPSPRALARLLTLARVKLTRAEAIVVATVEREVPAVVAARDAVYAFHRLLRSRKVDDLGPWIEAALASPVASFAKGVIADRAAVAAAIATP